MRRIALVIAALVGFSLVASSSAHAGTATILIKNNTNRSAWITVYGSCGDVCKWHISTAFCLPKHSERFLDYWKRSPMAESKVRAEVKIRDDCRGPNIADVEDYRKTTNDNPDNDVAEVNVQGNEQKFWVAMRLR